MDKNFIHWDGVCNLLCVFHSFCTTVAFDTDKCIVSDFGYTGTFFWKIYSLLLCAFCDWLAIRKKQNTDSHIFLKLLFTRLMSTSVNSQSTMSKYWSQTYSEKSGCFLCCLYVFSLFSCELASSILLCERHLDLRENLIQLRLPVIYINYFLKHQFVFYYIFIFLGYTINRLRGLACLEKIYI